MKAEPRQSVSSSHVCADMEVLAIELSIIIQPPAAVYDRDVCWTL